MTVKKPESVLLSGFCHFAELFNMHFYRRLAFLCLVRLPVPYAHIHQNGRIEHRRQRLSACEDETVCGEFSACESDELFLSEQETAVISSVSASKTASVFFISVFLSLRFRELLSVYAPVTAFSAG